MNRALTASVMLPERAPVAVKNSITAITHRLRRKMSRLTLKKRPRPRNISSMRGAYPRVSLRIILAAKNAERMKPHHCAASVPKGMPMNPSRMANTKQRLQTMLTTFTTIDTARG